ncbi:hypothetical protein SAMN06295967_101340 [Belliella buryatensis]|uniref:Uncharacterized protein n=1 Tax=Belliella buryatensis TaxID=1500549 RepID=A0A239ASV6_9BACT|nr:hypothetical protein [Belliella buryatensis]SNR98114.1 hypothetical protein SAMN06295967_101340 [Belliella buryatensis]
MKKMIYAVFACLMMTFTFTVNAQEEEEEIGGYVSEPYICPLTEVQVVRCEWVWHDSYCDPSSHDLC